MKPLVSILIPAYNAEQWVAQTIQSALDQTWPNKEIIVVDDGSRDGTLSVARTFASQQVSVITQPNQGAAAARNNLLSRAQGDFIQWLDADDLLSANKVASQMEAVERGASNRVLLSSAWGRFRYRTSKAQFIHSGLWCDLSPTEWLIRKLGENLFMQTASWLVSRELTNISGPWDTRLLSDDDGEYFCRVLLKSDGVRFVPGGKVFYRATGSGSLSQIGISNRKMDTLFLSMELYVKYLRSVEDSERVRETCLRFLQRWLFYFYPERRDIVESMQQLAGTLGGRLEAPRMSWKYSWLQKTLGWKAAKRFRFSYNAFKSSALNSLDKALYKMGAR
jgi:glycosyltransferase involved in cell wall biosynthesis